MISDTSEQTATAVPLPHVSRVFFEAKFRVRATSASSVSRRGVIDRARSGGARIVGLTAPAGYGKSTMLAEWAATEARAVGWATLDRFDDDPASMLAVLAAASAALSPRAADLAANMGGVGASVLGRSAPMLADALADARVPFVLFIDDVHAADSEACHDALEVVLAGVPAGSQVVMASRHELPFFARLRAQGTTLEIGTDDLRVDHAGARMIFDAAHVAATADEIDAAVERCEGWPTGVFLCALATDAGADVVTLAGSERFVADYLYRECLASLPDELQVFLRRTAVLDRLSASLCDAVLDASGSGAMLRRLEALNLFIVPLDRRREWYRYHGLFREFLLAELRRDDAAIVDELHRRAADWCAREGATTESVEHLVAARDYERAVARLSELALPMYQDGRVAVVERWLGELGDDVVAASPDAAVIAAWTAILQGKSPASERWAGVLDRLHPAGSADEVVAFESARAMVRAAMCLDGPQQVLRDAQYAATYEPVWSPWYDQALHLLGSAWLLVGDTAAARAAFLRASASARELGNADSVLLSEAELAILAIDKGRWSDAETHAHTAVRAVDEHHMEGYPTTALAMAVAARVAHRRGDDAGADSYLTRAMRARVHCTHVLPYLAMRTRLQIAKAFAEAGDHAAASHLMREIASLRLRRPNVGMLATQIDEFADRLSRATGDVSTVPLSPAELRLLPYLQTHLTIAEIGKRLYVSRNTVSSQVGSIYRKLGATTRATAVDRAVEVGLLGA